MGGVINPAGGRPVGERLVPQRPGGTAIRLTGSGLTGSGLTGSGRFTIIIFLLVLQLTPTPTFGTEDADQLANGQPHALAALPFRHYADALLLGIASAGERLVAVGEHGLVLLSDDQGASWRQSRQGVVDTTLSAVTFVDQHHGWAVGREEAILHSRDGGESWQLQHWQPIPESGLEAVLLEVLFIDASQGFAVGANGIFMSTNDGGSTWQRTALINNSGFEPHLFDIAGGGETPLWISAEEGTLLRSDDHGRHWQEVTVPFGGSLFGVVPINNSGLLAFAMLGKAFYSPDQGGSWLELSAATRSAWMNGRVSPNGEIMLAGYRGTLGRYRPGDETIQVVRQDHRRAIADLIPLAADRWLFVGEGGAWQAMAQGTSGSGSGGKQ